MTVIAIDAPRLFAPSEKAVRRATDRLAKAVIRAYEDAVGIRICKTCNAKLPSSQEYYRPRPDYFKGLSPRCRACADGHSSWGDRDAKYDARKRISEIKRSEEWSKARQTRNYAATAILFYLELADTVWWGWDNDIPSNNLGDKLYEIAEKHNIVGFLQMYSTGFVALTEGSGSDVDLPDLARLWEHHYRKWQDRWRFAVATLERLEATFPK